MIWENVPREENIGRLAEMGIRILVFLPCFNKAEKEYFLAVMKEKIENLKIVYIPQK